MFILITLSGLTEVTTDRNDRPLVMVLVRGVGSGEGACPSPDYRNKLLMACVISV